QRDWLAQLQTYVSDLSIALRRQLTERAQTVDWYARRLQSPSNYINQERLKLRNLQASLNYAAHDSLNSTRFAVTQLRTRLQAQLPDVRRQRLTLENQSRRLADKYHNRLQRQRQQLDTLTAQLEMLNPQRTLERGYAIISNAHGHTLRNVQELHPRSILTVQLARGSAEVGIASVQPALK
ncbi:MAG: exodeoxyribonuclease VII large subunit, partial [Herbaspirillum sp.]